jgi:hypothetical protein
MILNLDMWIFDLFLEFMCLNVCRRLRWPTRILTNITMLLTSENLFALYS